MKKLLCICFAGTIMAGCGKVEKYSNDFGSAIFLNVVPFTPPPPGSLAVSMRVYEDTLNRSAANLGYRSNSGYLAFAQSVRNIELRSSADLTTKFAVASDQTFEYNKASTYLVYDTVDAATSRARIARLSDDLTAPATGFVKVRFLPLAIFAPPVDVTLLRTSVTPADSVTFFNRGYIGLNPTEAELQAMSTFTTMPLGNYTVKVKAAGTQTLILPAAGLTVATLAGTGATKGISSLYISGTAKEQPLALGIVRHYP